MNRNALRLALCLTLVLSWRGTATPNNPNTDWLRDARYGVFMHFLLADAKGLALVQERAGGCLEAHRDPVKRLGAHTVRPP